LKPVLKMVFGMVIAPVTVTTAARFTWSTLTLTRGRSVGQSITILAALGQKADATKPEDQLVFGRITTNKTALF
jgi:hypothetical protein